MNRLLLMALLLLTCSACTPDSDDAHSAPVHSETATTSIYPLCHLDDTQLSILQEENIQQGQTTALVATVSNCSSDSLSYQWSQLAGPAITTAQWQDAILSFDAQVSGNYQFSVVITDNASPAHHLKLESNITVANNTQPQANIRQDRSLKEGSQISVRVEKPSTAVTSIQWQQLSGPQITIPAQYLTDNSLEYLFLATAPEVNKDELVTLGATLHLQNGQQLQDQVTLQIKETHAPSFYPTAFPPSIAKVQAWDPDSPFSTALEACVYSPALSLYDTGHLCTVAELPLLGTNNATISIDDIMDRVVVSHTWMGDQFRAILEHYDQHNDLKTMFKATNAIVISSDIRPSAYWGLTGAIYLDADYFWLTPEQRDTVNESPDRRNENGHGLQYIFTWRYVKNGLSQLSNPDPSDRVSRTYSDIAPGILAVLYHELAHANDFFPYNKQTLAGNDYLALQAYGSEKQPSYVLADSLHDFASLQSQVLRDLARVEYASETIQPSTEQLGFSPQYVGDEFSTDIATALYNYTNSHEDLAMLVDEFFMLYRHGISRDVASVDSGGDNVIRWGERGRIAQDSIAPRLEHTLTELYPWLGSDKMIATLIADLPATRALPSDQAWRDTVDFENEKIETLHFDNRSQPARGSEDDQLNQYPAINPDSRGMLY